MAKERFTTFAKDLQLATAGLAPEAINRELARFAKSSLADAIASREASSLYTRYVSTKSGVSETAPEEQVEAPGPILYVFSYWEPVLAFARAALIKASPRKDGDYIDSQVVMVGGQIVPWDAQIAADEEVTIVATVPYARKIESGFMQMSVPDAVFQGVRKKLQSQFGRAFEFKFRMIPLPGGYTLRGRFRRGYKEFARTKLQRDTASGAQMTYPAIIATVRRS